MNCSKAADCGSQKIVQKSKRKKVWRCTRHGKKIWWWVVKRAQEYYIKSQCRCCGEEVAKWRCAPITKSRGQKTGNEKALESGAARIGRGRQAVEQWKLARHWGRIVVCEKRRMAESSEELQNQHRRKSWRLALSSSLGLNQGAVQASHNLQTCCQREAHCSLANVNSPVEMAIVESGKRVYLGKVMLDRCDQEGSGLSTLVEYSGIDVRNFGSKELTRWRLRRFVMRSTQAWHKEIVEDVSGSWKHLAMWSRRRGKPRKDSGECSRLEAGRIVGSVVGNEWFGKLPWEGLGGNHLLVAVSFAWRMEWRHAHSHAAWVIPRYLSSQKTFPVSSATFFTGTASQICLFKAVIDNRQCSNGSSICGPRWCKEDVGVICKRLSLEKMSTKTWDSGVERKKVRGWNLSRQSWNDSVILFRRRGMLPMLWTWIINRAWTHKGCVIAVGLKNTDGHVAMKKERKRTAWIIATLEES